MKRMVLIPEERLLRYEERDKQRAENGDGIMYGGGEDSEETREDSLSVEMIVRGIPKTMKTRAEALLTHLKEREDIITWDNMGQVLLNGVLILSKIRKMSEIQYFRSCVGCDETP